MKALHAPVCLALLVSLGACGDEDGPAPYRSGVQQQGPVSQLDEDDLKQLCRSFESHVNVSLGYDALALALCLPQAIVLGGSREGCERRLADCKRDLPPPVELSIKVHDEGTCLRDLRSCDASVVQLEGCVDINIDWAFRAVERITCGNYTEEQRRHMTNRVNGCVDASPGCRRFIDISEQTELY